MRGVVWDGQELIVTDALEVRDPGEGEVKVKVLRSGVCHSDINMMHIPGAKVPVVLGHEAAGVVEEVGPGVTGWKVGDAVMVGTQTPCGTCRECLRGDPANCDVTWGIVPQWPFAWEGKPVASFANVSSFAGEIVVKASQLYATGDLPPEQAALIGCAVSTGYCASCVLGEVGEGDRVAVIGVGGIGVNAIQGAKLAGASVLAVDMNPAKEEAARSFGADAFVVAQRGEDAATLAKRMREAFEPIDVVVECCGAPSAVEASVMAVKRGGRVVLIGMTAPGAMATFSLDLLLAGRDIVSTMNGGARPERDYPELIRLAQEGKLDIAGQVTQVWPLAEVEDAIAALESGKVTRAVLDHTI
ncbi:MAG: alcohol dehydrogenase catalytic domain-containing protein [Novosphingobium sp.]|nr:alcohol dehydrogenase catalytic domain-containing protein [Novosphingobium sp.]